MCVSKYAQLPAKPKFNHAESFAEYPTSGYALAKQLRASQGPTTWAESGPLVHTITLFVLLFRFYSN